MLAETDAYRSLEENLKKMGFERAENDSGQKQSWRWKTKTDTGATLILELLADNPELSGGKVKELPTERGISALNIPHSSMVFDHHEVKEIRAELFGGKGVAIEKVRHADLVSFTCLKAFALDQRHELKDAHDIVYCLQNVGGGIEASAKAFQEARSGKHAKVIDAALAILRKRFCDDELTEGYKKDGAVAVALFEIDDDGDEVGERRVLRRRQAADLMMRLLNAVG